MKKQTVQFLKECFGEELAYPIKNEKESRDETVISEVINGTESLFTNALENAPTAEIKKDLLNLYSEKGNAVDAFRECGIEVVFSIEKQPTAETVDKSAETEKFQQLVSDLKNISTRITDNVTQDQMQNFFDRAMEVKEQTEFMLNNNVLGEISEKFLAESLSNFKYLENAIKETGFEIDTRSKTEKKQDLEKEIFKAMKEDCRNNYYDGKYEISPSSYDDYYSALQILDTFNKYTEALKSENEQRSFSEYFVDTKYESDFLLNVSDEEVSIVTSLIRNFKDSDRYNELADEYGVEMIDRFLYQIDNGDIPAYEVAENIGLEVYADPLDFVDKSYHLNLVLADKTDGKEGSGVDINNLFTENEINFVNKTQNVAEMLNNSVTYLVQQQGFKIDEVLNEFHNQVLDKESNSDELRYNNFIVSVFEEVQNAPQYAQLTSFVSSGGKELIDLLDAVAHKDENKVIEISDNATIGLFDGKYNGTGSNFEIELEKPFLFTADMVDYIQIEDEKTQHIGNIWKGEVNVTDISDTIRQELNNAKEISFETVENVKEEFENFEQEQNGIER